MLQGWKLFGHKLNLMLHCILNKVGGRAGVRDRFIKFHFTFSGIPHTASQRTLFTFRLRSKQLFRDAGLSSTVSRGSGSGSAGSLNVLAAAEPGKMQGITRGVWAVTDFRFFLPNILTITAIPNLTNSQQLSISLAHHRISCSAEMSRLRKSVEALADASTIADCSERLTEAKACLSTVPSLSARSYWEKTWLNRADRFADALCPISRLGASRSQRRYIFLDKPTGVTLSKG